MSAMSIIGTGDTPDFGGHSVQYLYKHSERIWPTIKASNCLQAEYCGLSVGVSGSDPKELLLYERSATDPHDICLQTHMLRGHTEWVRSVSFSSAGKRVVSGSGDQTVRVWDSKSGQCLQTLKGHDGAVSSVSFSGDGRQIVSGSCDKTVRVWDSESGECLQKLEGHADFVSSVSFSSDGTLIVSGSDDLTIRVWDCESGICLETLKGHKGEVTSVSLSSNGKQILSGSDDGTVRMWDRMSGQCLHILDGHKCAVLSVSFNGDESEIVSGSADNTVRLWNSGSGRCLQVLEGHNGEVNSVSFSGGGKRIVSGSGDRTVRVWDSDTGQCLQILRGHSREVNCVSFSGDGKRIVSGSTDATVRVWDNESGQCMQTLEGHTDVVNNVSFCSGGECIVSGSEDETLRLWDSESGRCFQTLQGQTGVMHSVSFSGDKNWIASGSDDGSVRVWESESGIFHNSLQGHTGAVCCIAFSTDGKRVVSGSTDQMVRVWDVESGQCLHTLQGHTGEVRSVSVSRCGKRIVSGSCDRTVRVWDMCSGLCVRIIVESHTDFVTNVSFSSDGKRIVSAGGDGTVRVWDSDSGLELYSAATNVMDCLENVSQVPRDAQLQWTLMNDIVLIWAVSGTMGRSSRRYSDSKFAYLIGCCILSSIPEETRTGSVLSLLRSPQLFRDEPLQLMEFTARCAKPVLDISSISDWSRFSLLTRFDVADTLLSSLPPSIGALKYLKYIDIRNCGISVIPTSWSSLLDEERPGGPFPHDGLLIDSSQLSALPRALRGKATKGMEPEKVDACVILGYLRDLRVTKPVSRIRMVTVGPAAAGKTYLSRALTKIRNPKPGDTKHVPGSTVGVDTFGFTQTVSVFDAGRGKLGKRNYHVDIWDFAGHEEYFPIHALLFSELVQYLLVINAKTMDDGKSHIPHFRKWLTAVSARAPTGRVVLVLSQADRIGTWNKGSQIREQIAERVAKCGREQAMKALPIGCGLDISNQVLVVDSQKGRFLAVDGVGTDDLRVHECGLSGVRVRLVGLALDYMSSQAVFQGGSSLDDAAKRHLSVPVAPVVPEMYLSAMHAIEGWVAGRMQRRLPWVIEFLLRIFSSAERAATSQDVMTFGECCEVLQSAGVSTGDEFERLMAVLQSWGVLFYYGTSPAKDFETKLVKNDDIKSSGHSEGLLAANTAAELVFVNPRVLVDVTAHLYVRHHLQTLNETVDDKRQLGSQFLPKRVLHQVNADRHGKLFLRYGIASRSLLGCLFSEVKKKHGLSISGVLHLIEAMQLVYRMDMHFSPHSLPDGVEVSKDNGRASAVASVYIIPSLISERKPRAKFPRLPVAVSRPNERSAPLSYFDFELEFNSTGLLSLIVQWIMQCKKVAENSCELKGEIWHGGSDVYGGENTIARIHWVRRPRDSIDQGSLGAGDSEIVRVQGGPLSGVTGDDPSVRRELYMLMRVVFSSLEQLLESGGPFAGIQLVQWRLPSPCNIPKHRVFVPYVDILRNGKAGGGVTIHHCQDCNDALTKFTPQVFRMPFWESEPGDGPDCPDHVSDGEGDARCAPSPATVEMECKAVEFVGDTIVPTLNEQRRNLIQRAHSLEDYEARHVDTDDQVQQMAAQVPVCQEASESFRSHLNASLMTYSTDIDLDAPRLFVLLPEDRFWWRRVACVSGNMFSKHRLHVLCEARTGPHLPSNHDGYSIRNSRTFVLRYGKQMVTILKHLSYALKGASFLPGLTIVQKAFGKLSVEVCEALKNTNALDRSFSALKNEESDAIDDDEAVDVFRKLRIVHSPFIDGNGSTFARDSSRSRTVVRYWQEFIDEKDFSSDRGGLVQAPLDWGETVKYGNGHVHRRWLCAQCWEDARSSFESREERKLRTGSAVPSPNADLLTPIPQ